MKIKLNNILLATFCLSLYLSICDALLDGIYCGRENCYDILELTREATSSEVRRSYRRLAKKTHPDLFRDEVQKKEAEEKFKSLGRYWRLFGDVAKLLDFFFISVCPHTSIDVTKIKRVPNLI